MYLLQRSPEFSEQQGASGYKEQTYDTALQKLKKFGGFDFLESVIENVRNLNSSRPALKRIFLEERSNEGKRKALKESLQRWADVLNQPADLAHIKQDCREKSEAAEQLLKKNLKAALKQSRELEASYRNVALFFKNTEASKVKNVSFLNASLEQLKDNENETFYEAVQEELDAKYNRLDLREHYSLLVVPGYLGSNATVEKWAKLAYRNKVLLVTDFENLDSPDDVMKLFEEACLTGGETYRSNVIMTCNWLLGRARHHRVEEDDDLYVPPSVALAGKIYKTLMSQVTAGKKHGGINEVESVKFQVRKSEIADLENLGLIPLVKEYERVMAFSAKTLFNGDNLCLQTYSVVRVFDYVAKVLMHFLNTVTFENFTQENKNRLRDQIVGFLNKVTGPKRLIENFAIENFAKDKNQPDRINLRISLKPFFPAKSFLITLDEYKDENGKKNFDVKYE